MIRRTKSTTCFTVLKTQMVCDSLVLKYLLHFVHDRSSVVFLRLDSSLVHLKILRRPSSKIWNNTKHKHRKISPFVRIFKKDFGYYHRHS